MLEESLTSLAVLKVNWDQRGKDYVDNFIPFVAEPYADVHKITSRLLNFRR